MISVHRMKSMVVNQSPKLVGPVPMQRMKSIVVNQSVKHRYDTGHWNGGGGGGGGPATTLSWGGTEIDLSSVPPTAGQLLGYDGSNIVGVPAPPSYQIIQAGSANVSTPRTPPGYPPNAITMAIWPTILTGVLGTDAVIWHVATYLNTVSGWNTGLLTLFVHNSGDALRFHVGNMSSSVVQAADLPIRYMIVRFA